jgi:hypothetical protein
MILAAFRAFHLDSQELAMSAARRLSLPAVVIAALIAIVFSVSRVALSQPDPIMPIVRWEYTTATVESGDLRAKLAEFGTNGWEVFSINEASQILEYDDDFKTRAIVEKYRITGRRPFVRR